MSFFFLAFTLSLFTSLSLSLLSLRGHMGGHEVDGVSVEQIRLTLGHPLSAEKELRAGHQPVFPLTTYSVCACVCVCIRISHLLNPFNLSCSTSIFYCSVL